MMNIASTTFGRPARRPLSRPSALFVAVSAGLIGQLHRLDRWLVERDHPEPQTPAEVLDWACRIEATDPGFAADLRAAALRAMQ
jgi:hypothetical protein